MTHHCPLTGRRSVSAFEAWLADDIGRYNIVLWIAGHAHRWAIDEDLAGFGFDRIKVASRMYFGNRRCALPWTEAPITARPGISTMW